MSSVWGTYSNFPKALSRWVVLFLLSSGDSHIASAVCTIPPASLGIGSTLTESPLEHDSKPLLGMGSSVFHVAGPCLVLRKPAVDGQWLPSSTLSSAATGCFDQPPAPFIIRLEWETRLGIPKLQGIMLDSRSGFFEALRP